MFFNDIFHLFFPVKCIGCDEVLPVQEKMLCPSCRGGLPETHFEKTIDNPLAQLFWGRVNLARCYALYYFTKHGIVQNMLHLLKYGGRKDVGVFLGKRLAKKILEAGLAYDMVIPVPLHHKKMKIRGYNQAEMIALGIAETLRISCRTDILVRKVFTDTQTKKNKWERYLNVKEVFDIDNPNDIFGKRILVVDDVITTGATIEAGIRLLLEHKPGELSVAAIATAMKQ